MLDNITGSYDILDNEDPYITRLKMELERSAYASSGKADYGPGSRRRHDNGWDDEEDWEDYDDYEDYEDEDDYGDEDDDDR